MQISCCSHIDIVMNILWMLQETHHVQVNFSRQILSLDWVIFVSDFVMSTVTLWVAGLLTTRKYESATGIKVLWLLFLFYFKNLDNVSANQRNYYPARIYP